MMTLTLLFSPISHFPEAKEKDPVEEIGKLWLQAEQRHNIREKFANFGKRVEAGTDFSNYLSRERELCVCVCVFYSLGCLYQIDVIFFN